MKAARKGGFFFEATMLKRLFLSLALALIAVPAFAAGTIPGISMTQQFGSDAKPLIGGRLYLIQAGTTSTPQNCYQDSGLSIAHPNPITLDAAGRIPQLFCADGSIKVRLTNAAGVTQLVADNLLVVGPSGGGGGGGSVDPTTVLATGDFKMVYGTGNLTGFVRCNGRTIGNASSGATERANADTSALFAHFWTVDTNLAVSGGRGASAAADYAASKTIALPDCRSRPLAGLSDMGNSDNGLFSGVTFSSGNSTTLGSTLGAARRSLLATNIPSLTSTGNNSISVGDSGRFIATATVGLNNSSAQGGGSVTAVAQSQGGSWFSPTSLTGSNSITVTSTGTNGTAFDAVSPYLLTTIYIKL